MFDYDMDDFKAPENKFEPLPEGDYTLMVRSAEVKPTKDGEGEYINASFEVLEGPKKGRVFFMLYNMKNKSEIAQNIGRAQFKDLRTALGLELIKDLGELLRKPFTGKLVIKKNPGYEDKNEIKKYTKLGATVKVAVEDDEAPF